jgi:hypothetical protein
MSNARNNTSKLGTQLKGLTIWCVFFFSHFFQVVLRLFSLPPHVPVVVLLNLSAELVDQQFESSMEVWLFFVFSVVVNDVLSHGLFFFFF